MEERLMIQENFSQEHLLSRKIGMYLNGVQLPVELMWFVAAALFPLPAKLQRLRKTFQNTHRWSLDD